jgi:hypothetical protein
MKKKTELFTEALPGMETGDKGEYTIYKNIVSDVPEELLKGNYFHCRPSQKWKVQKRVVAEAYVESEDGEPVIYCPANNEGGFCKLMEGFSRYGIIKEKKCRIKNPQVKPLVSRGDFQI